MQTPEFLADNLPLNQAETLYTVWIGTNDGAPSSRLAPWKFAANVLPSVGLGNLVMNAATPGKTIVDTTKCLIDWIEYMYNTAGARNFLFMNVRVMYPVGCSPLMACAHQMIPLHRTILYGPNGYPWAFYNKPFDAQAWMTFIQNVVPASNAMADAWLRDLAPKLSGSHIGEWQ